MTKSPFLLLTDELQVFAFCHQLDEFGLVDDFLTSCVYKDTALLHQAYQSVVDALFGLSGSRDVERYDITGLEQFFLIGYSMYAGSFDYLSRAVGIESIDIHSKPFGNAGDVAAYISESEDTELLAKQL